jgi:hypothetical protein
MNYNKIKKIIKKYRTATFYLCVLLTGGLIVSLILLFD